MKRALLLMLGACLIACVSPGCSSKKKNKGPVPPPPLASWATPRGGLDENSKIDLGFAVTLSASRKDALIHYECGADPADPTVDSQVYYSTAPIIIGAAYRDGTFILKFFAEDPVLLETEDPFHTETYAFVEDAFPPEVFITPNGGEFAYPTDVTITLTARDANDHYPPVDLTVYWTVSYGEGTAPEDPRTSPDRSAGMGTGTIVPWTGGNVCKVKAYAVDPAGHESIVKGAEFYILVALIPVRVQELVNAERLAASLPELTWNNAWAYGCETHCKIIDLAEQEGTLMKPQGPTQWQHREEGYIPFWWASDDPRTLIDWPFDETDKCVLNGLSWATMHPYGYHAVDAYEFFYLLKANTTIWNNLMSEGATEFGCGFCNNVWEILVD